MPGELIAARVVQDSAAAKMTPQLLATFRAVFSGKERGYGAVLGLASAIAAAPGSSCPGRAAVPLPR